MKWEQGASAISSAPPQAVWDVLLDGRRWSFWNPGAEWMWLEGAVEPGTLVTIKLQGVRQTALRIVEARPPQCFALALAIGPIARFEIVWTLAIQGSGTRIDTAVAIAGIAAGWLLRRPAQRVAEALPGHVERLAARAQEEEEKNARLQ
ncbi:MAG: SRPBCC family protein [Candidatus Velthaea sp.]|jgi:hypothetical protein